MLHFDEDGKKKPFYALLRRSPPDHGLGHRGDGGRKPVRSQRQRHQTIQAARPEKV